MICIIADVDPVYVEMICEIKNQETSWGKARVFVWMVEGEFGETDTLRSFVRPSLKSAR